MQLDMGMLPGVAVGYIHQNHPERSGEIAVGLIIALVIFAFLTLLDKSGKGPLQIKDPPLLAFQSLVLIAIGLTAFIEPHHFLLVFSGWFVFILLALVVGTITTPAADQLGLREDLQFILQFGTPIIVLLITKTAFDALRARRP